MILATQPQDTASLLTLETGLTVIAVVASMTLPAIRVRAFKIMRIGWHRFAARKGMAVIAVGCAMLLGRVAILPWFPAPQPLFNDDFSYLLQADTFLHGRLANPTPVMWTHFETDHVTMFPTYASMYFPGPAIAMAAGKLLFGHPWAGILITCAMMCAAVCWALQGWLPAGWALLGGVLAILRLGMFSYWANSYTGGATISALGGALVIGSVPRLIKSMRLPHALVMGIGMAMLALTRPWEGVLICIPAVIAVLIGIARNEQRPRFAVLARRAALPLCIVMVAVGWLGYYDKEAFGKASIPPYKLARAAYAVVPYYIWQPPNKTPNYRFDEMRRFYTVNEMSGYEKLHTLRGFFPQSLMKLLTVLRFMAGLALLPPIFLLVRALRDRRMLFFAWATPFWMVGLLIGVFLNPHYVAPFTAVIYIVGLQCMRHLRQWRIGERASGAILVNGLVLTCFLMGGLRLFAEPMHLTPPAWPLGPWVSNWIGPTHYGQERAAIEKQLSRTPGKHLVLVRYTTDHEPCDEWVYNGADIDGAQTVWAHDMTDRENEEIVRYYRDRDVWLVQPDVEQGRLMPYPMNAALRAQLSTGR
jgi:hypothetical protein